MFINVIKWSYNRIWNNHGKADFYLEQDSWNDSSYFTYYHLHISGAHTDDGINQMIGGVKILKRNQQEKDIFLIPKGELTALSPDYCSLGQSLDYYERISQLDKNLQDKILIALNDIIFNPELRSEFEHEEGFRKSLLRGVDLKDDIFQLSPHLLSRNFNLLPDKDLKFKFKTKEMVDFVEFDFTSPEYMNDFVNSSLPNRIAVIIGRNGSGKSTFLSKISRIVFASTNDREHLAEVGSILPVGLGFPRIVNISYSAFDTFQVPGIRFKEKEQIARDINKGVGRYIFCGVRDISKELEQSLSNYQVSEHGLLSVDSIINDRQSHNILKSITALNTEFTSAISAIKLDSFNVLLFTTAINILSNEPSLSFLKRLNDPQLTSYDSKFFSDLSTGHKFVLHSIVNIVRYCENRTLILFDEPEIHLHPPLLAVLMKSIRMILNQKNSFMILCTHSPVVLQETLLKHVFIIRREGNVSQITHPDIQTFGENIGMITSHIFELSSDLGDFHEELDNVLNSILENSSVKVSKEKILSKLEKLFEGGISLQARAYVMSQLNTLRQ